MDSAALPWVRGVTICGSTQIGKTEAVNNVIGYYIHQRPSPAMMVMPNADSARLAGERRILPMVMANDALRAELTERSHDVKNREMAFRSSILYLRSAHSPTEMSSVPVRLVVGDEVKNWPKWSGKEASPLALVRERTRTFTDHVIVLCSTPSTRDGLIQREFMQGDQRRYHVPCPHCGAWQTLTFKRVKWDNEKIATGNAMRAAKDAWYECDHCSARIDDRQKREMLPLGMWVPEGKTVEEWRALRDSERNEHRSYHLWAGYSPWITWWKIAATFLDAKHEPADMMNFVNNWLAEIWEDKINDATVEAIAACVEERVQGECPDDVMVLTGAVDVQKDRLEWSVQGWGMDEESWLVAAGKVMRARDGDDWRELSDILFNGVWGKQQLRLRCCVVDSRYRPDEALDFVRRHQPVARMIIGVERDAPIPFTTHRIDKHPRTGIVLPNAIVVWHVNVGMFKDLVASRIARTVEEPNTRRGRMHLPNDLPVDWLTQMASEHKVRERSGSKEVHRWVIKPGHQRNEAWDLTVYQAAAGRLQRCDLLRSEDAATIPKLTPPPAPTTPKKPHRPPGARFPLLGGNRP